MSGSLTFQGETLAIEGSRTMTLADRTSPTIPEDAFPSRSWRSRLLRYLPNEEPNKAFNRPPKPRDEIADLLFMSALDLKAPPQTTGSTEVLDAIVQDHLAQTPAEHVPAALLDPPASPAPDLGAPAIAPGLSDEDRTALLQREIETLLRDTGAEPASAPASPPLASSDSEITPEELDTLLADQAQAMSPEINSAAAGVSAHTAQQLSEAEGVPRRGTQSTDGRHPGRARRHFIRGPRPWGPAHRANHHSAKTRFCRLLLNQSAGARCRPDNGCTPTTSPHRRPRRPASADT